MNEEDLKLKGYVRQSDGSWAKPAVGTFREKFGACTELQKRETPVPHQQKERRVDEGLHRQFRVAVHFKMSDRRRRDLDGGLATILDCLIAARRQLAERADSDCDVRGS